MVVYGSDEDTRVALFGFLRSLNLNPIEWNDAVTRTGKASPYVGEILTTAFGMAQAFVVLRTPMSTLFCDLNSAKEGATATKLCSRVPM
jgi:Predicted nucleotide-binding protein containing TIR-like domain